MMPSGLIVCDICSVLKYDKTQPLVVDISSKWKTRTKDPREHSKKNKITVNVMVDYSVYCCPVRSPMVRSLPT